jgi:hypothetical protein
MIPCVHIRTPADRVHCVHVIRVITRNTCAHHGPAGRQQTMVPRACQNACTCSKLIVYAVQTGTVLSFKSEDHVHRCALHASRSTADDFSMPVEQLTHTAS